MADEEVKIHVRADADTKALEATEAKIKELYQLAARYEAKGIPEAAKSVRGDARELEKDVARYKREQHAAEKDITRERREQAAVSRAEETQQSTTGRMLYGGRSRMHGGLIGGAAAFGLGEAFTEYTERQGIALRAAAQRALDVRGIAIAGSWRGSSSKTLGQGFGATDGTIVDTKDLPGKPPPVDDGRNWLVVPATFIQRGIITDITETYWLSGPKGWPAPVYAKTSSSSPSIQ